MSDRKEWELTDEERAEERVRRGRQAREEEVNDRHNLISRAQAACNKVAKLLSVPPINHKLMQDAARRSPDHALACYTAILNSYGSRRADKP